MKCSGSIGSHLYFDITMLLLVTLCAFVVPSVTVNLASFLLVLAGASYFLFKLVRGVVSLLSDDNYGF